VSELKPITALGATAARSFRNNVFSVEENPGLALASLALRRGSARPTPFGLDLPGVGAWTTNGAVSAFWTGPDQWMIEAQGRAEDDFAAELAAQCRDCSVTEQTDGFVVFELRSDLAAPAINALMSKLVNLDPARLDAGSATRTGLEHLSVFVIRRAADHLAVLGMRSAAASLWYALETAISRLTSDADKLIPEFSSEFNAVVGYEP